MWKLWALLAIVGGTAGCQKDDGCATDKDCKADRVCDAQLRLCVDPGGTARDAAMVPPGPSGADLCVAGCEASRRCGTLTEAQAASCRTDCETNRASLDAADAQADKACARAPDLRRQRRDCLQAECNQIAVCIQRIDSSICATREPPVPAACVGAPPAGAHYQFATSAIKLPFPATSYSIDIDGDGRADNQLKALIGAFASANFDLQGPVDRAVQAGELVLLPDLQAADVSNGCAKLTVFAAQKGMTPPRFDGTDVFAANGAVLPTLLSGAISGGKLTTIEPRDMKPGDVQVLPLNLPFANGILPMSIYGAHVQGNVTAAGVMSGEIHGVIRKTDIDMQVIPAVAQLLTDQIRKDPMGSTTETIIRLFEDPAGNPASKAKCMNTPEKCCATPANRAKTCEIVPAEVKSNALIGNVLAPDVQVFQNGNWSPVPKGVDKDAMSVGLGFTAVKASRGMR